MTDDNKYVAYGSSSVCTSIYDLHAEKASNRFPMRVSVATANDTSGDQVILDVNQWLPMAAKEYDISKNIKDYVMVIVPSIVSDLPNTNGTAIQGKELLKFRPYFGLPAYKTFKGKPTFVEHKNDVITDAKGVILDTVITPLLGYGKGLLKVVKLLAWDRLKDRELANDIASKRINAYSMGSYFESFDMSDGSYPSQEKLKQKLIVNGNKLVYRNIRNITGFECSSVASPAFISAISNKVMSI